MIDVEQLDQQAEFRPLKAILITKIKKRIYLYQYLQ